MTVATLPKPLDIRRDDWVVFSTGMGVLTYSMVTEWPRPPRKEQTRAVVQTLDGKVFRRLVVASYPSVHDARLHAKRFNQENENVEI